MLIVAIKTDQQMAEVGLFEDEKKLKYEIWEAHRTLTDTIHVQIKKLLDFVDKDWGDVSGVVVFKGPGSFTGLRIGFAVANTLAYINKAPIVAKAGDTWLSDGLKGLLSGEDDHIALPDYGAEAHITTPQK